MTDLADGQFPAPESPRGEDPPRPGQEELADSAGLRWAPARPRGRGHRSTPRVHDPAHPLARAPSDAVIAVTGRCNAHCVMCNVWQHRRPDELEPCHMRKLPPQLKTVNLSGGEPFLRDDLPAFVREVRRRCPAARITISTNAYLPRRIAEMMGRIRQIDPAVRLAISLDGLKSAHDHMRGDEGAFDSAMELIDLLEERRFEGMRLGMTLTRANLDQLPGVADLAGRRGLELGVVAAHACRTQLHLDASPAGSMPPWLARPFREVVTRWLRSWRPRLWLRAHFAYHTYRLLGGWRHRFGCRAAEDFFFLQSDGTVYSCSVQGRPMGNLITQDWREIWRSPSAGEARRLAGQCPESCWMICTARSAYRMHPLWVIGWILLNKLACHLGLPCPKAPDAREDAWNREELPSADPSR